MSPAAVLLTSAFGQACFGVTFPTN